MPSESRKIEASEPEDSCRRLGSLSGPARLGLGPVDGNASAAGIDMRTQVLNVESDALFTMRLTIE